MTASPPRKCCVVTGSRAEYGLLRELMRHLAAGPATGLQLVVTGAHLSPAFGETWRAIQADGFAIDAKVDMALGEDGALAAAHALARGLSGMAEALDALRPDLVVILGDRYEMLAAAQAALLARIPVAHIHGGEITEGAFDDSVRHALTKLSALHFTAAEEYRRRVVQMGEPPERVFNVGAMCLDAMAATPRLDRAATLARLGLPEGARYVLATYHPVTLGEGDPGAGVDALRAGLAEFPGHHVVLTGVNADPGHGRVAERQHDWARAEPGRVKAVASLGQELYTNAMRWADAVVGNSSSGIIEAPALLVPTVNVGPRQDGRIRAASVIDCPEDAARIARAARTALDPDFRARAAAEPYPFGGPGAAAKVAEVLAGFPLERLRVKHFHDLPGGAP